ncbi:putative metal-binding motif-containing protein [Myxococcota bacterium]|nr:putative metal-binding motif-containing protein [Myxococcota bacterium]
MDRLPSQPVRAVSAIFALATALYLPGCEGVLRPDDDAADDDAADDDAADDDAADDDAADDDAADDDAADDDTLPPPSDVDGDGFPAPEDCDDSDPAVSPGAEESANGVDDDCDGVVDDGTTLHDDDGDGVSEAGGDCDDADPTVSPGAVEVAYDGVDQDCDGRDLVDADGDGFPGGGGPDCDDTDPAVAPGAEDLAGDGLDSDCDGTDGPPPPPVGSWCLADTNVLAFPGEVEFSVSGSDAVGAPAPEGSRYDDVEIEVPAGTTVLFQMRSIAFDPYFVVLDGACGVVATSADIQAGYDDDDRLEFIAPAAGVYTVVATTALPGSTGSYVLSAFDGDPPEGDACGWRTSTLAYGETVNGSLGASDAHDGPAGPDAALDDWEFPGMAGEAVTATATGATVDLRIWLLGPDCAPVAEGAGGGAGLPATLSADLTQDGPHTLYVSTAGPGGGPYQLALASP